MCVGVLVCVVNCCWGEVFVNLCFVMLFFVVCVF